MRLILFASAALALSACGRAEEQAPPDPAAPTRNVVEAAAPATAAADGWQWLYFGDQSPDHVGEVRALYGPPESEADLVISCKPATGVVTLLAGGGSGEDVQAKLTTASGAFDLAMGGYSDEEDLTGPSAYVDLRRGDAAIAALAAPQDRIIIEAPGGLKIDVPWGDGIPNVLSRCL